MFPFRVLDEIGRLDPERDHQRLVPAFLALRARLVALLPRRRRPHLRTASPTRTYGAAYAIEQLGPPASPTTHG